jgi:hypothetical protein
MAGNFLAVDFYDALVTSLFGARRGSQVVRPRSAKPLCAGSIPARASKVDLVLTSEIGIRGSGADTKTDTKMTTRPLFGLTGDLLSRYPLTLPNCVRLSS